MRRSRVRYYSLLFILSLLPRFASPQQEESKPKDKNGSITLQITVTDKENEQPIKDADVWVKSVEDGKDLNDSAPTDAQGLASFPGVPQGWVLIQVTARGFKPYSKKHKVSKEVSSISINPEPVHNGAQPEDPSH